MACASARLLGLRHMGGGGEQKVCSLSIHCSRINYTKIYQFETTNIKHSLWESRIRKWLSWVILAPAVLWSCHQGIYWAYNCLKAQLGLEAPFLRWFPYGCWLGTSVPHAMELSSCHETAFPLRKMTWEKETEKDRNNSILPCIIRTHVFGPNFPSKKMEF